MRPAGFCNNCGRKLVGEPRCPACGAVTNVTREVEALTAAVPPITDELPERAPQARGGDRRSLQVIRGRNAGASYLVEDRHVIGRATDVDIFLDDVTVSRHHAEIFEESGVLWVRDLGSMNGTYLNGQPVDLGQLFDGDVLQVGLFKLVFVAGP